jgi:Asp-tRNA(Asn)/Glu-tRNA(Gln) amidotransferase A subunit family amidase
LAELSYGTAPTVPASHDRGKRDEASIVALAGDGSASHIERPSEANEKLLLLNVCELDQLLRDGEITAVELVSAAIDRIRRENQSVNAIVTLVEEALIAAEESDKRTRRNCRLSSLDGVPFTVKDNLVTRGIRTTAGSMLLKDHVPRATAPAVQRLEDAGAVLVGKTNCPEFALDIHTSNRLFGHTWNPLRLNLTSGGSSGGESSAIAAGFVGFGLGTDLGGSIRWPAHCTGLASIRPTPGLVPRTGILPHSTGGAPAPPNSLSVQHQYHLIAPIARHVSDLGVIMRTISGPDGYDMYSVPVPFAGGRSHVSELRCTWLKGDGSFAVRSDLIATVEAAARCLRDEGVEVVDEVPPGLHRIESLFARLRAADGLPLQLTRLAQGHQQELTDNIRDRLSAERPTTAAELRKVAGVLEVARARIRRFMEKYQVLLMPVASVPAFQPDRDHYDQPKYFDVEGAAVPRLKALSCTAVVTALGLPAAVVPFGQSREGLPAGIQVVGRPFYDDQILAVAQLLQARVRTHPTTRGYPSTNTPGSATRASGCSTYPET